MKSFSLKHKFKEFFLEFFYCVQKRVLSFIVIVLTCVCLIGCKNNKDTYSIKIIDIDGEVLGEEICEVSKYSNLYEALVDNFEVDGSIGEYGAWINSINNSVVDANWSLMAYRNNEELSNSCDLVVGEKGDCFEFRNECWQAKDYGFGAALTNTDVLLDQTIYHYLKTNFKQSLENIKDYLGSSYWDMLTYVNYLDNYPNQNVLEINFSNELKNSLSSCDVSKLEGINYGKYYIHAKALNLLDNNFIDIYQKSIEKTDTFSAWTTPFVLFPAAFENLSISSESFSNMVNGGFDTDTSFGPDATFWSILSMQQFCDKSSLFNINDYVKDWEMGASNAMLLAVASCLNIDNKDLNLLEGKDYLTYIFDKYYDSSTGYFMANPGDKNLTMAANQIYCYLLTYKIHRDLHIAYSCFGPINH